MLKLKGISIFGSLGEAGLEAVGPLCAASKYLRKTTIFSEGDPPDWFYIIIEGKVKITKLSHDGKEIILEVILPGDFFGGIAVMRGFPYPANAVAMEDSEIIKISKADLDGILERFPSVMHRIMQNIGDRMRFSHEALKSVALDKVSSRIAALLHKLASQSGKKTETGTLIDMRLTKQEMAEMVGTTVETAIRTMSRFKKLGLLEEKSGRIIIKDPEGLKSLHEG